MTASCLQVRNVFVIPKHFFVREIIEERKPLAMTARRAGWVGCNILLNRIPLSGKVFFVRNGQVLPKEEVLSQWQRTLFLREERAEARGWLIEVMNCVDQIGKREFDLDDVYAFEQQARQPLSKEQACEAKDSTAASEVARSWLS